MPSYEDIEDFLQDPSFVEWASGNEDLFWSSWLAAHPGKEELVRQALQMLAAVRDQEPDIREEEINGEVRRFIELARERKTVRRRKLLIRWGAAAALVLLLLGGAAVLYRFPAAETARLAGAKLEEKTNDTERDLTFALADGTRVTLRKKSRLTYPTHFDTSFREVTLEGDAFFDVAPNREKPFLIYANETVVRVIGTRFWVETKETAVTVSVRSGKVSVFDARNFTREDAREGGREGAGRDLKGVILLPNQQATFTLENRQLQKGIVDRPEVIAANPDELVADDRPVTEVFRQLEKMYGIDIEFDEKRLKGCLVTVTFTTEGLFEKLQSICEIIGARYETVDGQVIVSGNGCQPAHE